ncbi:LytR/AlgR family response regulator transcription factor [Flagellimonas onchidii]|uniref:LytR/AlgR family response regulator transcription factor n=1 Tax=Flagellimonas onchidii TaxID=2562684 RepID=UPI0010A65EB3|nr:LytTR family DNA-binding domain-containing protein [Allomuricauda onchidii]
MRKDRLYFLTFMAIAIIFAIIGGISGQYFVRISTDQLLSTQLESSKREAKEVAAFIANDLENDISKENIIDNIQKAIENSNSESSFISIMDWGGKTVCHPDRTQNGLQIEASQSLAMEMDAEISSEDFYTLLINSDQNPNGNGRQSGILYIYPIKNSDWIVAAHANFNKISLQLKNLRNRFYTLFSIMGFIVILTSVITVRLIGSLYEKKLETKNEELESEVISLAKLNSDLGKYQKRVIEEGTKAKVKVETEENQDIKQSKKQQTDSGKKRILTYLRNELLPITIDDIAYIYTENTITYVVDIRGKKSTTNSSLEELYSGLDSNFFYRANRQFIIAISAIEKIIRYSNSQLKILVNPNSEIDIIIGKNKAAEFKQWLNL